MTIEQGRRVGIDRFSNFHKSGSVRGMKWLYYGKDWVSRNSVGKRFHATPLICCDRFEIHRNKGLSVRRQNSSAL